jgi:hypothetical protein
MSFMLLYQHGERRENKAERFETKTEAIVRACALIAQGDSRYLNIENERGFVIFERGPNPKALRERAVILNSERTKPDAT